MKGWTYLSITKEAQPLTITKGRRGKIIRLPEPLRLVVYIGGFIPLVWLILDYIMGNLTVNPVQAILQRTGKYALVILILTLACTPANTIFHLRQALRVRRALGLLSFFYASLHLLAFIGLDYSFDLTLLRDAFIEQRNLIGLGAFAILLAMAVTSFRWWMKRMGKNWKRLHRLVYLGAVLVIIHFSLASKGDLLRIRGDILEPAGYGLAVALLLLLRVPFIRRLFARAPWIAPLAG